VPISLLLQLQRVITLSKTRIQLSVKNADKSCPVATDGSSFPSSATCSSHKIEEPGISRLRKRKGSRSSPRINSPLDTSWYARDILDATGSYRKAMRRCYASESPKAMSEIFTYSRIRRIVFQSRCLKEANYPLSRAEILIL